MCADLDSFDVFQENGKPHFFESVDIYDKNRYLKIK